MIIIAFLLSLYSAILSTFLFARWIRLSIARKRASLAIQEDLLPIQKEAFIIAHPLSAKIDAEKALTEETEKEKMKDQIFMSGLEMELELAEADEVQESVEEREYVEEQKLLSKFRGV